MAKSGKYTSLLIWISIVIIASLFIAIFPTVGIVSICALIGLFLFIYLFLAPNNIFFTFVKEGTAKMVVRGDGFRKTLIQWEKHTCDEKGNIVDGAEFHFFGGLRIYGIWLVDKIYTYKFEWTGLEQDGITPRPHAPEKLDSIFLKQYVYFSNIVKAEDAKGLPLNVCYVLTIQVENPYKSLFKVHNWLATVFGRVAPEIRDVIAQSDYKVLNSNLDDVAKQVKVNIAKEDGTRENILQIVREAYGTNVLDVKILTIDPPEDLREATLLEFRAEQNKKRIEIEAEAEKNKRIKEAEGTAKAYELKIEALGGGERGRDRVVTIEVSEKVKDGDKIIAGDILEAFKGFAGTIPSGFGHRGRVPLIDIVNR